MKIISEIISTELNSILLECCVEVLVGYKEIFGREIENFTLDNIVVRLFPLSRFTPSVGYSGADIFVIRFEYGHQVFGGKKTPKSSPMIVKIGNAEKLQIEEGFRVYLEAEAENMHSLKQFLSLPFTLVKTNSGGKAVLFTKFEVKSLVEEEAAYKHQDLWRLLHEEYSSDDKVNTALKETLDGLKHLHNVEKGFLEMTYAQALGSYARGLPPIKYSEQGQKAFRQIDSVFKEYGEIESASGRLFKRILQSDRKMQWRVSAVHGDLHPKNIVKGLNTKIIDFGWAQKKAPTLLDYLLLDINLRASTLSPYANRNTVIRMCKTLSWVDIASPNIDMSDCSFCKSHMNFLEGYIWKPISDIFDEIIEGESTGDSSQQWKQERKIELWNQQYIIPLFVLSYALLKYLDDTTNQTALIQLVKSCTSHILARNDS